MKELTVGGYSTGLGNLLGFQQAGYNIKWLSDYRSFIQKNKKTLMKTFPGIKISNELNSFKENPNVLVTSPNCAQVSNLGMKRVDRPELKTQSLFDFEFTNVLQNIFEHYQPDFIILEYLLGLLQHIEVRHEGLYRPPTEEYLEYPKEYRAQIMRINALTYGVPQKRERLFIIFSKKELDFVYTAPDKIALETQRAGEVFAEIDELRRKKLLGKEIFTKHSDKRIARFDKLKYGESYYGSQNNKRIDPNKFCPVIASHCTQHVHPWEPRTITGREAAIFQGFPYDFEFHTRSNSNILDLVGKCVPPPITKHIGEEIKHHLKKREELNV